MSNIKLTNAAKYYRSLPHQIDAFNFLETHLLRNNPSILEEFAKIYRTPKVSLVKSNNPHEKLINRLNQLNIELDPIESQFINGKNYRLTIIGIEGVNTDFTRNANVLDKYNDLVLGALNFGNKVEFTKPIICTMEPGRYYTKVRRLNALGAAKIVLDMKHKGIWKLGKHKNQSNCLIQIGGPVKVHRDNNADGLRNDNIVKAGYYGINFHHNNSDPSITPSSIGRWSAGCTVIPDKSIHQDFMNKVVRNDYKMKQTLGTKISYIPLDGSKIF